MALRYVDFDKAFAEEKTEPLQVRLFAQTWLLPGVMPAAAPLKVARYMAEGRSDSDLSEAELLDFASTLIPQDILDAWFAKGLDISQLSRILPWVMRQYMGADDEGEAPAPSTGASPASSPDGASSKPTSPESTDSTSPATSPA